MLFLFRVDLPAVYNLCSQIIYVGRGCFISVYAAFPLNTKKLDRYDKDKHQTRRVPATINVMHTRMLLITAQMAGAA